MSVFNVLCEGKQNVFLLPFVVYRAGDIRVYFNDILQTQNYSLSQLGDKNGAKISFLNPLGSRQNVLRLKVERVSEVSPWVRFHDYENLQADTLNAAQDHIYSLLQDQRNLGEKSHMKLKQVKDIQTLLEQSQKLYKEVRAIYATIKNIEPSLLPKAHLSSYGAMPVGALLMWFLNTPPKGYLMAHGQILLRQDYPELWSLLSSSGELVNEQQWKDQQRGSFSAGDGSLTFRMPDLRSYFLRGRGDLRTIGSEEGDAIRNITGGLPTGPATASIFHDLVPLNATKGAVKIVQIGNGKQYAGGDSGNWAYWDFDASRVVPTATENRPKNIALNFCIKVKSHI